MTQIRYLIFTAMLGCSCAFAAESTPPQITVFGTATKMVEPDTLQWSLTVTRKGKDLEDVAATHAKDVSRVVSLLENFEVPKKDIQTSRMRFGENWVYKDSSRVLEGYVAHTDVNFETQSLEAYAVMWSKLAGTPGVSVSNVAYAHSERIALRDKARIEALLIAKEKALDMAAALGSTIGAPLNIVETPSAARWQASNMRSVASDMSSAESGALSPGQISIEAQVTVTFLLE